MKAVRMKFKRTLLTTSAALATTLLVAGPALAYLDPASSTFILQTIVAGIFSALYFVKLNWQRLKAFFSGKRLEVESPDENEQAEK